MTPVPVAFDFLRQIQGESRRDHIEDHGPIRSVLDVLLRSASSARIPAQLPARCSRSANSHMIREWRPATLPPKHAEAVGCDLLTVFFLSIE